MILIMAAFPDENETSNETDAREMVIHALWICPRGDFDDDEEDDDKWKHCTVVPVRDDVASIFGRSTRGEKEFAEFSVNQRAAVSLARYLQDPLVEMAGEWRQLRLPLVPCTVICGDAVCDTRGRRDCDMMIDVFLSPWDMPCSRAQERG